MSNSRRSFLKSSTALASTSLAGQTIGDSPKTPPRSYLKDAGLQFCLAHFYGMDKRRIELSKQMQVLGAVGGTNSRGLGLTDLKPWDYQVILAAKEAWAKEGLTLKVIEGPPTLSEKTKLGLEGRDQEIENFISFMKNLSKAGIDTICYNWMPVISWARTDMDRTGRGGALVSAFDEDAIKDTSLTAHGAFSKETMWKTLEYFLKAVVPEAEKVGVKLALHPDDPPVDAIRGISRILTSAEAFKRVIELVPSSSNGITLCQGTFATMGEDIPALINYFGKRGKIHFVHFRDVRGNRHHFEETFHDDGKTDMYQAMKTHYEIGFKGPIRPDHVPTMAGDSNEHPGYSNIGALFAIGYMRGLIEAIAKNGR